MNASSSINIDLNIFVLVSLLLRVVVFVGVLVFSFVSI